MFYDTDDFEWSSLLGHSASLERLEIGQITYEITTQWHREHRHVPDFSALSALVGKCKELKELSLRLPKVSLEDLLALKCGQFDQYLVSTLNSPLTARTDPE